MGRSDYFASGDWNFFCDFCGAKEKAKNGEKTWNGYYVCRRHKEVRNLQDFIRGIKDDQTVPWSRQEAPDTFVPIGYTRLLQDNLPLAEALTKALNKTINARRVSSVLDGNTLNGVAVNGNSSNTYDPAENIALNDSVSLKPRKVTADAFTLADSIAFSTSKALLDSFLFTEGLALREQKPLAEAFSFLEVVSLRDIHVLSEAFSFVETSNLTTKKAITEAFTITETVITTINRRRSLNSAPLNKSALG